MRGGDAARLVRGGVRWRRGGGAALVRGGVRYRRGGFPRGQTMPVVQRVLGESDEITLKMRKIYAETLCEDSAATLDDLREAVATLGDVERTARRVFGGAHPLTSAIEGDMQSARAALRAREAGESVVFVRV